MANAKQTTFPPAPDAGKETQPEYLTPAQVAAKLGCNISSARRMIGTGAIPSVRLPGLRRVFIPKAGLAAVLSAPQAAVSSVTGAQAAPAPSAREFGKPPRRRHGGRADTRHHTDAP
jgi:hypothetical protein